METLKAAMTHHIEVWWWNMGRKQLDFRGTYADYFKKIGAVMRCSPTGYIYRIATSSDLVRGSTTDPNPIRALDNAIILFLTLMGDRALFHGANSPRTFSINKN